MSDKIAFKDVEELNKALGVGGKIVDICSIFDGSSKPLYVEELETGNILRVLVTTYSKELKGSIYTVGTWENYKDLNPGEYKIVEVKDE